MNEALTDEQVREALTLTREQRYELADIEKNHEEYVSKTHIAASRGVRALLK